FFGSSPEDPKAKGLDVLRRLRGRVIFPAVIMVAEEGNELTAVRALQLGAVDYLPKRLLTPERLNTSVRLAVRRIEKRVQRKLATAPPVKDALSSDDDTTRQQPKFNLAAIASSAPAVAPPAASTTERPARESPARAAAPAAPVREVAIAPAPKAEGPAHAAPAEVRATATLVSEHTYTATGVDFRAEDDLASGAELVAQLLKLGEQIDNSRIGKGPAVGTPPAGTSTATAAGSPPTGK